MDKYDEAIAYLREANSPQILYTAWNTRNSNPGSCLFDFVEKGPKAECGCLTQVKYCGWPAKCFESEIKADERIPREPEPDGENFKEVMASLEVFAEWQRKIDKELNR